MVTAARTRPTRPVVGVTGPDGGGAIAWWFTRRAVLAAGARPILITPRRPRRGLALDALIVGGGADVGTPDTPPSVLAGPRFDAARDELESRLLHEAARDERPVLGICRGAQLMNVYAGGSLLRDLATLYEGRPPRLTARPRKHASVLGDSRLRAAIGRDDVMVNCLHRHAVGRLGRDLRVVARDLAGVAQAIEDSERDFWIGVQWHPEYLPHRRAQRRLFRALVAASRTPRATQPAADLAATGGGGGSDGGGRKL